MSRISVLQRDYGAAAARGTLTNQLDSEGGGGITCDTLRPTRQRIGEVFGQLSVFDRTAGGTDHVDVVIADRFVDVRSRGQGKARDLTVVDEDMQVSVDVSKAQRPKLVPQLRVELRSGEMDALLLENLQEAVTLSAASNRRCHLLKYSDRPVGGQ